MQRISRWASVQNYAWFQKKSRTGICLGETMRFFFQRLWWIKTDY